MNDPKLTDCRDPQNHPHACGCGAKKSTVTGQIESLEAQAVNPNRGLQWATVIGAAITYCATATGAHWISVAFLLAGTVMLGLGFIAATVTRTFYMFMRNEIVVKKTLDDALRDEFAPK